MLLYRCIRIFIKWFRRKPLNLPAYSQGWVTYMTAKVSEGRKHCRWVKPTMWTATFYQTLSDDLQSSAAARFRCSHESGWLCWHQSLVWSLINFLLESRGQTRPWCWEQRNGFSRLDELEDLSGGSALRANQSNQREITMPSPGALNLGCCMRRNWWKHLTCAGRRLFPAQSIRKVWAHAGTRVPQSEGGMPANSQVNVCSSLRGS